jgi:hypothetical protein
MMITVPNAGDVKQKGGGIYSRILKAGFYNVNFKLLQTS